MGIEDEIEYYLGDERRLQAIFEELIEKRDLREPFIAVAGRLLMNRGISYHKETAEAVYEMLALLSHHSKTGKFLEKEFADKLAWFLNMAYDRQRTKYWEIKRNIQDMIKQTDYPVPYGVRKAVK